MQHATCTVQQVWLTDIQPEFDEHFVDEGDLNIEDTDDRTPPYCAVPAVPAAVLCCAGSAVIALSFGTSGDRSGRLDEHLPARCQPQSRRRCGSVPAQMWPSPGGADVAESRRRCGRVPAAQMRPALHAARPGLCAQRRAMGFGGAKAQRCSLFYPQRIASALRRTQPTTTATGTR